MSEQCDTSREKINCDAECWIQDRILKAIELSIALHDRKGVHANEYMVNDAISGIVNGCAVEIVRTLGLEPEFTNLKVPNHIFPEYKSGVINTK
jgi:hypothetical protein